MLATAILLNSFAAGYAWAEYNNTRGNLALFALIMNASFAIILLLSYINGANNV